MNSIAKEMASYLGQATLSDEEFLEHYGMPRRSGRYPWGSGKDDYQHSIDFLGRIEKLKKKGWKETPENIERDFGLSVKDFRMEKSLCNDERKYYKIKTARALQKDGLNTSEIGKKMGVNESTVRGWFEQEEKGKYLQVKETVKLLKDRVDDKKMVDVGKGVERELNISRERLDTAIYVLESQGYHLHGGRVSQLTNKNQSTTQSVLCVPGTPHSAIYEFDKVHSIKDYISRDGGQTYEKKFNYPASLDKKRLYIRYPDEGGDLKDGIIELRRNVPDLSLGESRYAQVRILVDNKSYLKGMAVYSDNMPDGVDVVFNTSKKRGSDEYSVVMKKIKNDPDNPFGSLIKDADQGGQYWYDADTGKRVSGSDPNVKNKKLGLINKRADEGDWTEWADALPSQFLSKQSKQLAKQQLDLAKANKKDEFDEIMSLTNPTVKKYYLEKFASNCDKAAVDLKAAALPGQKYHVIIPINTLKDNEIYAPQYEAGTKLALIRYPHGGTFEIPILTVIDKNPDARKIIGTSSIDAVGINKKVADRLSGADFDGDTVMCIPTHDKKGKVKIISTPELEGLKGFDNKAAYQYDEVKTDKDGNTTYYRNGRKFDIMKHTDNEMGKISNLISDMTLQGANSDELARAVRHSMVVIDAEKHKLDYKQSYIDNNIAALKRDYQPKFDKDGNIIGGGGAFTIISKSKGPERVEKRKGQARINQKGKPWYDPNKPEGALINMTAPDNELYYAVGSYDKKAGTRTYKTTSGKNITYKMDDPVARKKYEPVMKKDPDTGEVIFTNRDGSIKYQRETRTMDSTRMAEADNAMDLVSPVRHKMEILYADYANSMKSMANDARKELIRTENLKYDANAKKIYAKEVSSLEMKLNDALKNAPRERYAGRLANAEVKRRQEADPDMKSGDLRKLQQRSVSKFRNEVGAVSRRERSIKIDDREWEAIQAGAISDSKLRQILANTDTDSLRERAMPKNKKTLSTTQISRIKTMSNNGITIEQIAKKMGISTSAVSSYLKGAK